jgi:transposase InsO family protein
MAVTQRKPRDVIHHADQGSPYTSLAFGNRGREAGVRPSMGSVGDAYDNAMAESFFSTLACELLARRLRAGRRVRTSNRPPAQPSPLTVHKNGAIPIPAEPERRGLRPTARHPAQAAGRAAPDSRCHALPDARPASAPAESAFT